ncbi:class I SAM-dependent methyltransferase [Candidatus Parcubacteria bacterium]|nr:class I SAM-dependent methyltransferase [Patescibacteria group bacterium]MBU4309367.1 class I SAM-dependent methyltransferase [Patescibacteria group bacterium]MBU4432104.1 class I SAM-dependent methyltransferase [Patescibacteria group bacterium]MBU4577728.1 class I SAM-dependent methyltransferase [Patescibacteria group bacterium]MCG2697413.1 class I SAM-dependent methyltransferase [Candidatus Parcubacteria bacterium]
MSRGENAMAGRAVFDANLMKRYQLPESEKKKYLETRHAKTLLHALPSEIRTELVRSFLAGKPLVANGGVAVIDFFKQNSTIIPALAEYPGTFTMLEKMYQFEDVTHPVDVFFSKSGPGGISLKSRYNLVNEMMVQHVREILKQQEKCLVLDLGSGPGRNCIDVTLSNPDFADRVEFHCIDTDPEAISYGQKLVEQHGLKNIKFVAKSMARLHRDYKGTVDYGLIIGVLCGLNTQERTGLLKLVKPYFRPGARVIGAGLLDRMLDLDLLCSYILREVAGWILQHPPIGIVQDAYEGAGYMYEGYVQEQPTRCYEIGIGCVQ